MNTPEMSLERFHLIRDDFHEARQYVRYIITRNLHEKHTPTWTLIHQAFNLASVVSYCRPFMRNLEGRDRESREYANSPIWWDAKSVLGKERFDFHRELLRQRNNVFAHSPSGEKFSAPPTKGRVVFLPILEPLNRNDTVMLRYMIKLWLEHLESLKSELS